jgi:hypothetical protein
VARRACSGPRVTPQVAEACAAHLVGRDDAQASRRERSGKSKAARVLLDAKLRTRDLKRTADTVTCGKALAAAPG